MAESIARRILTREIGVISQARQIDVVQVQLHRRHPDQITSI